MNIKLNKKAAAFAGGVVSMACLVACGDDITQVTNVGMDSVAAYEDLSECTAKNEGVLVYVKDKGTAYMCSDESWSSMKGENGKNGNDGKNGENGTSCSVKELADGSGFDVLCGDKKVGTLKNGEAGKAGTNGTSCTVSENAAKGGYDLVCGDKTVTVKNGTSGENCTGKALESGNIQITCGTTVVGELKKGTDGTNGKSAFEIAKENDKNITDVSAWLASLKGKNGENCTVADGDETGSIKITCGDVTKTISNGKNGTNGANGTSCTVAAGTKDGEVVLTCGTGETAEKTTLYKAVCGTEPYDPAKKFCFNMELKDLCGSDKKAFDPTKFECVEGVVKKIAPKCNGIEYDPETQFCAKRGTTEERPYKMVTIAPEGTSYSKTWMAENLNYVTDNSWCGGGSGTTEGDCTKYGRLYTWAAAVGKSEDECGYDHACNLGEGKVRGVCPDGWHLPTMAEWEALIAAVGGEDVAGKKLKAKVGWKDFEDMDGAVQSGNGDDAYGFSALPAGNRMNSGTFYSEGRTAFLWSSIESNNKKAYAVNIEHKLQKATVSGQQKYLGFSVRCIQDYQE